MEYPLISEYRESILSAAENLQELSSLRPVLDDRGEPVMSSGNFAVVFKMREEGSGKLHALKCFLKEQEGRDVSYKKIADELETVSSPYILPLRYLEKELFVDSGQCSEEEFPVVVMEWVEGETLDAYLIRHLGDPYELAMLGYRFNRMAAWLLAQPFAHGDLKPDNILVRGDGSLVLVDYDGMFVPSMKGEKAREIGSPDYRHPLRTDADFSEYLDDFPIAVIALSLKAIALNPGLKFAASATDSLLLSESDFRDAARSERLKAIQALSSNAELSLLLGAFYVALAKNSLDLLSFRLFMTEKPKKPKLLANFPRRIAVIGEVISIKGMLKANFIDSKTNESKFKHDCFLVRVDPLDGRPMIDVYVTFDQWAKYGMDAILFVGNVVNVAMDECIAGETQYINADTEEVEYHSKSYNTFAGADNVGNLGLIGVFAKQGVAPNIVRDFLNAIEVERRKHAMKSKPAEDIPTEVASVPLFMTEKNKKSKQLEKIDTSVTKEDIANGIEDEYGVMYSKDGARLLKCNVGFTEYVIKDGTKVICDYAFEWRGFQCIVLPASVISIGNGAFKGCFSFQSIVLPDSVTSIGDNAFGGCTSLQSISIPDTLKDSDIEKARIPQKCQIIWRK